MNAKTPSQELSGHASDAETGREPGPIPTPGPIPGQISGPIPGSSPELFPWPPDWWKCMRLGPVSGRYVGEMTVPTPGGFELDLRVDIDPRYANSPVMDRVSGDIYQVYHWKIPSGPILKWRVYRESWIVDKPTINWYRCQVEISGSVRYWKGLHLISTVQITIPWSTFQAAGPATVTFTQFGGGISTYSCSRKSHCFRDMTLEVDVCQSVNTTPLLPSYDTHWHNTRPADLPQRVLTIEEAYREAGICMTINPVNTVIDDSAPQFNTWSPSELHDAMETNFSQYPGGWPKWQLWGLMAGTFDNASVGGIMFDAAAMYGGAGEPPDRQGFAVFRNHSWFNNLVPGAPANQNQAWSMRHFLYTWVHEAGHAFNLLHSWNKNRPDALSWMNYDWKYNARNGDDNFWWNFRFRFDDEELIHIRHGDRASVIMGGDPWASGGHLESPTGADAQAEGDVPLELLLRSKQYFEFMEPVIIEFRLRNLLKDIQLNVDARLAPDFGGAIVYIRRPDGRTLEYAPIFCKLGTPSMKILQPANYPTEGEDRYSEAVFLSYGNYGFYFDQPGEYLVRALYQGPGDLLITSNVHRVRVGNPLTKADDRLAQDFFSYGVGMSLYLDGSRSPFLTDAMNMLESLASRSKDSFLGVKAAAVVAHSLSRPFFRIPELANPVLTKTHDADPEKALELTAPALELFKSEKSMALNLEYHHLVRSRAELLATVGQKATAKKEVGTLVKDLADRGVNQPVLDDIKAFQESL